MLVPPLVDALGPEAPHCTSGANLGVAQRWGKAVVGSKSQQPAPPHSCKGQVACLEMDQARTSTRTGDRQDVRRNFRNVRLIVALHPITHDSVNTYVRCPLEVGSI